MTLSYLYQFCIIYLNNIYVTHVQGINMPILQNHDIGQKQTGEQ